MISLEHYQALGIVLFFIGAGGVIARRNIFVMLIGIELMLNAVNLSLIGYSRYLANPDGQVFTLFMMAIAAAEICVGLALVICMFKLKRSTTIDDFAALKQ
jgi:NADH-quinone oxidoreductase subunit K